MATNGDAAVFATEYAGPSHQIVRVWVNPSLTFVGFASRRIDFAGLVGSHWRHPVSAPGLFAPATLSLNFGIGNVATRVRFANPQFLYHVFGPRGLLRLFSWPIPYGNPAVNNFKPVPAAAAWIPAV